MSADRINPSAKDESVSVNNNTPLDALYFFIDTKPVVALSVTPFDALGVKYPDRWSPILFSASADSLDSSFDEMPYPSILPPFAEEFIYRLPLEKVLWKHTPLATADQHIQDCLKDEAEGIFAFATIIFKEVGSPTHILRCCNLGKRKKH
ncbi:MAG: hypothetical protein NC117_04855 [Pseudoflavonifractor sp.]|nr:hypothetical protein [Pseudoflavonifractor sp.]